MKIGVQTHMVAEEQKVRLLSHLALRALRFFQPRFASGGQIEADHLVGLALGPAWHTTKDWEQWRLASRTIASEPMAKPLSLVRVPGLDLTSKGLDCLLRYSFPFR